MTIRIVLKKVITCMLKIILKHIEALLQLFVKKVTLVDLEGENGELDGGSLYELERRKVITQEEALKLYAEKLKRFVRVDYGDENGELCDGGSLYHLEHRKKMLEETARRLNKKTEDLTEAERRKVFEDWRSWAESHPC